MHNLFEEGRGLKSSQSAHPPHLFSTMEFEQQTGKDLLQSCSATACGERCHGSGIIVGCAWAKRDLTDCVRHSCGAVRAQVCDWLNG